MSAATATATAPGAASTAAVVLVAPVGRAAAVSALADALAVRVAGLVLVDGGAGSDRPGAARLHEPAEAGDHRPVVLPVAGRRWARSAAAGLAACLDGRRPVVHVLDEGLWRQGRHLARLLGGAALLERSAGGPLGRGTALWLRATVPVVAVAGEGGRAELRPSLPTVVVAGGSLGGRPDTPARLERLYHQLDPRTAGPQYLAVNARFTARPTTGVERVAGNVAAHLEAPRALLVPHRRWATGPLGHLWEQAVLPWRAGGRRAWLWSPCNFGPVAVRRQVASVYDVAPVDHPEWFSGGYRRWFSAVVGGLCRRARLVAVPTEFTRGRIGARFAPAARLVTVPGGVHPPAPPSAGPEDLPAEVPDGPFVCFVGSLEPRKDLATLVQAMARVQDEVACPLVVVGPTASSRVFAEGGLPEADDPWVRWLGRVDDPTLVALLRSSACLAYPSRYEGYGLPPLEAMAAGALVVATDIPPVVEACGPAPRYVPPQDPDALAAAVLEVLRLDPQERQRRLALGAEQVARRSWSAAARALEEAVWGPPQAPVAAPQVRRWPEGRAA